MIIVVEGLPVVYLVAWLPRAVGLEVNCQRGQKKEKQC